MHAPVAFVRAIWQCAVGSRSNSDSGVFFHQPASWKPPIGLARSTSPRRRAPTLLSRSAPRVGPHFYGTLLVAQLRDPDNPARNDYEHIHAYARNISSPLFRVAQ